MQDDLPNVRSQLGVSAPGQIAGRPKREKKLPRHADGHPQVGDDIFRGQRRAARDLAKKNALPQVDETLFDFRIHPSRCAVGLAPLPRNSRVIPTA